MNATIRRLTVRWRSMLLALIAWAGTSACYKWQPVARTGSGTALEGLDLQSDLRLTLTDGRVVMLRDRIRITTDSLIGFVHPPEPDASRPTGRRAIALSEIESIERRQAKTGSTVLLISGVALITAMVVAVAADPLFSTSGS